MEFESTFYFVVWNFIFEESNKKKKRRKMNAWKNLFEMRLKKLTVATEKVFMIHMWERLQSQYLKFKFIWIDKETQSNRCIWNGPMFFFFCLHQQYAGYDLFILAGTNWEVMSSSEIKVVEGCKRDLLPKMVFFCRFSVVKSCDKLKKLFKIIFGCFKLQVSSSFKAF